MLLPQRDGTSQTDAAVAAASRVKHLVTRAPLKTEQLKAETLQVPGRIVLLFVSRSEGILYQRIRLYFCILLPTALMA